jgi:hypothetical protein
VQERSVSTVRSGAEAVPPEQEPLGQRDIAAAERSTLELKMFEDLRAIAQPGAIISVLLVLLLMAGGDAAILIATKGWPF